MKKIYLSPAIETVEIGLVSMLCDFSPDGNGNNNEVEHDPNPFDPAPKIRPGKPF